MIDRCAIKVTMFLSLVLAGLAWGQNASTATNDYTRTEDIIYGRKYGTALTMDMFAPQNRNRAAVVYVVSGGWFSSHEGIAVKNFEEMLKRGYTVFAVVHGSQPKFTIPEILEDLHRAIRYIRYNADRFNIDRDRLGITGASAGGHLSLMIGTSGKAGPPTAGDPIDRQSSRVQAVACFFPPTDFLNYGQAGRDAYVAFKEELKNYTAPFQFVEYDHQTRSLVRIEPLERCMAIMRDISPISQVTANSAPSLIIHGDADFLVPLQQSSTFKQRMEAVNVPVKLIVKPGAAHGWKRLEDDRIAMADWFDTYLLSKAATQPASR